MKRVNLMIGVGVACAFPLVSATPAGAEATGSSLRHVTHVDASGLRIETETTAVPYTDAPLHREATGAGIIWHIIDPISITYSVCLSDTTDETWVGHNLNSERLSYLQTTGDGTPIYEFNLLPETPDLVAVASAEDASLGVLLTKSSLGVSIRAFDDTSGPTPLWTYFFSDTTDNAGFRAVDVSANGSIVAGVAYDSSAGSSAVVILDGATGAELNSLPIASFVSAIELSDNGSRAVLTEGATARVVETAGLTTLHSFAVSGAGGYHRLSRDGTVVVAGGFDYRAYRDNGDSWDLVWSQTQSGNWFGGGLALSANGDTLFVAHHNYLTGYVVLTYRIIDLVNGVQIARTITNGAAGLQDTVQVAQASANGQVFAVASWGTADNVHPEVQVFDRDAQLIGFIDTPGSPFSIDLSRDGQRLVAGGKAIHANINGNGSDTYAYGFAASCPWDCQPEPDGEVNIPDFLAILTQWGQVGTSCDFDGGGVGVTDFLAFLGNFGPCP
jgi:hypothetical protein